ncbi:hypothetical protein EIN_425030 [Entamoeba invadens IP1]|uniref:Uncharacterized protein n=1 Tax=Entamoeba invadens IP1 TaxID=370355 RepID=A0A0A1U9D4_ENTIV|nr:hypothetical protein EIN_425030 [Entamoeba invadens IP1]ELP89781.1 hypothetical protein EIN_425030 [Entamoeba invadens IP1]|eukprot:XP_004256552.1 hypothetical protein EIN_425030 [Entamoeba invadens IP1]
MAVYKTAFAPVPHNLYQVFVETAPSSPPLSGTPSKVSRDWNDESTSYVILKYRKWQLKERKNVPLKMFHTKCSEDLFSDLHVKKTPTQVRDKINNTRSAYHTITKQIKQKVFEGTQSSLSDYVYTLMRNLFNSANYSSVDLIEHQIKQLTNHILPKQFI